jgi:hypothetical protein
MEAHSSATRILTAFDAIIIGVFIGESGLNQGREVTKARRE